MQKLTRKKARFILSDLTRQRLVEICRMFGLAVSGTKEELIDRILNEVKPLSDLLKVVEEYGSYECVQKTTKEQDSEKIFKEVVKVLKNIKPPGPFSKCPEKSLEFYILGYLEGYFRRRKIGGESIQVVNQIGKKGRGIQI